MKTNFYRYNLKNGWRELQKDIGRGTAMLMFSGVFMANVLGGALAQTVTLKEQKASLHQVLEKIRKQANVDLIGDIALLRGTKPLTIDVKNTDLKTVLKEISLNQPVELSFQNNTIIVKEKASTQVKAIDNARSAQQMAIQQEYSLVGTVTDEKGKPLKGVTVKLLNSGNWASTTADNGTYAVRVTKDAEVLFSILGYEPRTLKVNGRNHLDVVLKMKDNEIEETVVTGYTKVRRENFTGAATMVTRKELEKFNSNNIFTVLQALDPSFKVDERVDVGSNPNALPQINIRGVSSVGEYSNSKPLIIMDGFEVPITTLYDIDVNRIESISILKDASSTSLYGSRGGNGVVVIETRLPKDGKFTVTYDMKPSISMVDLSDYNLMNAREKLDYEKIAGLYRSKSINTDFNHIEQEFYDNLLTTRERNIQEGVDTYWLKQPVRNTFSVNNSLRMEGGGAGVRYSLEGSYYDFKGVMKESGRKRGNAGFTLIYRIPDVITFRNVASYLNTKEYNSPYGSFATYTELNPYERIYNENGQFNVRFGELGHWYSWGPTLFNPLYNASLGFRDVNLTQTLQNNTMVDWYISPSFILRGSAMMSRATTQKDRYTSPFNTQYATIVDASQKGQYIFGNGVQTKFEGKLDMQYSNMFGKHQIVANGIAEMRMQNEEGNSVTMKGFIDDRFMTPQMALQYAAGSLPESTSRPVRSVGFLGSLFYTYDNRYNVSGTLRSDGASIYGSQNRFGTFWSAGFSHNMHNEEWFKNDIVTRFRWFINTGTSSTINDFNVGMVSTSYRFITGSNYYNQYAAIYSGQGNPSVRWPEQQEKSIGADIGVLGDFLKLNISYYNKTTNRMISKTTVAPSYGFADDYFFQNLGKVQNKGFETMANVRVMNNTIKDMSWYISLGVAQNRGTLKEISNELRMMNESLVKKDEKGNVIAPSKYYQEGESLSIIRAVPSLGIDPASGRELFLDRNGNVTYTWQANNQVVSGDEEPDLFGSVGTAFNYKGLSVQLYGNYSIGGDTFNKTLMNKIENNDPYKNADKRVLEERWKQPGDQALYKSINDLTATQPSSRFVQKESFLRLSSININYSFSNVTLQKYKLERLRVNFSMNDAFRWSTVRMERGIDYPYAREFNLGLMIQF